MKILSAEVNSDGALSLMVEYQKLVTIRSTAVLPCRAVMVGQGDKAAVEAADDAAFYNLHLEKLRAALEDPVDVAKSTSEFVSAIIGANVVKE